MKAIILASGPGSRLFPLTKEIPKTLVEVNGVSLLERIIQSLIENNITDIIIATGYLEEKIKEFIKEKFPELKITFVKNPIYDRTNYIYSLWLARDPIGKDDIILLHGDLFFEPKLVGRILKEDKSCVLVSKNKEIPEKDFKARIKDGLITEIGVNIFGDDARFLLPLYKIVKDDFKAWLEGIEKFIKEGKVDCYAENVFNVMENRFKLYPVYYENEFAMEIDNLDDLEKANNKNFDNKEEIHIENLREIKEIFDKFNIKFWLDWGTLLGAVREGKIIEWDHDVDLGLMAEDLKRNISVFSEIKKRGFFLKEPLISEPKLLVLNFWRFGCNVGIWPYYESGKDNFAGFHSNLASNSRIAYFLWYLWCSLECGGGINMPINKFKLIVAIFVKHFTRLLPEKIKSGQKH